MSLSLLVSNLDREILKLRQEIYLNFEINSTPITWTTQIVFTLIVETREYSWEKLKKLKLYK